VHSWAIGVGYLEEVRQEDVDLLRRYVAVLRHADPEVRWALQTQLELLEALYTRQEPRR
jgi:hypothetical protein